MFCCPVCGQAVNPDGLPFFICEMGTKKKGRASRSVLFNANKLIINSKSNLSPSGIEAEQFGIVLNSTAKLGNFGFVTKFFD